MAITRRWYLARMLRASTVANNGGRSGFVPSMTEYMSFSAPGRAWGFLPVPILGIGVAAVSWDDGIMDSATIASEVAALQAAPDNQLFDLRASFSSGAGNWTRFVKFKTALDAVHIDTGRIGGGTNTVKHVFREAVRHFVLYAKLGPVVPQRSLGEVQSSLPKLFRDAFHDRLLEMGIPSAKLGSGTTDFRTLYRGILSSGFAPEIEDGRFHLGRKDTNLGGSAAPAVIP